MFVATECGKEFLDLTTGIGVTNLGHSHPRVLSSVAKAVGEGGIIHQQQNIMRHRPMVDLIDRLGALPFARDSGLDAWFFWNSGAEAVEASIKLARQVNLTHMHGSMVLALSDLAVLLCACRRRGGSTS